MACSSGADGDGAPAAVGNGGSGGSVGQTTQMSNHPAVGGSAGTMMNGTGGQMGGAGGGVGQSGTSDIGPPDSGAGDANSGPIGDMTGTTAITVDAFLNSMGVSSHVGIGLDAPAESTTAISYLGVKNIRGNSSPSRVPDWIAMHKSVGIRLCLLTDNDLPDAIDSAKQLNAAGALLAVEGPNEPNNWPGLLPGSNVEQDHLDAGGRISERFSTRPSKATLV